MNGLQELLDLVKAHGGTLALSKDPNSDEWVASVHWFPTKVKMPAASKSGAGSGTTIQEALDALRKDME